MDSGFTAILGCVYAIVLLNLVKAQTIPTKLEASIWTVPTMDDVLTTTAKPSVGALNEASTMQSTSLPDNASSSDASNSAIATDPISLATASIATQNNNSNINYTNTNYTNINTSETLEYLNSSNQNNEETSALPRTTVTMETETIFNNTTEIPQQNTTSLDFSQTSTIRSPSVTEGTELPLTTVAIETETFSIETTKQPVQTTSTLQQTTQKAEVPTTTPVVVTTSKPEDCMKVRKDDFISCFKTLGDNAEKYVPTQDLEGFLDDMCDPLRSKPLMVCIKEHFQKCPAFLDREEVTSLEFGPYHIMDIIFFSSINQMCTCAPGLICIQELLKVKQLVNLTAWDHNNPWLKTPNYKTICDYDTARYIGCVRKNLRQCQSPLTKRYGQDFTNVDAEDLKLMYDFTKEHCDTVNADDFLPRYRCLHEKTLGEDFKHCIRSAETLPNAERICRLRSCVETYIEDGCDEPELTPLYIDAMNIYRHSSVRLLNTPCSDATDIAVSVIVLVLSIIIVIVF